MACLVCGHRNGHSSNCAYKAYREDIERIHDLRKETKRIANLVLSHGADPEKVKEILEKSGVDS